MSIQLSVETKFNPSARKDVPTKILVKFDIGGGREISMCMEHLGKQEEFSHGNINNYAGSTPQILLFDGDKDAKTLTEEHAARLLAAHANRDQGKCVSLAE